MDRAFGSEEKQAYQLVGRTSIDYFLIASRREIGLDEIFRNSQRCNNHAIVAASSQLSFTAGGLEG
jgi:hypothetical protein